MVDTLAAPALTDFPFALACRFANDGSGEFVAGATPATVFAEGAAFRWVHVSLANARGREWIAANPDIPHEAREALLDPNEHARLHGAGSLLWGVFPDFAREPGETVDRLAYLHVFASGDLVVTTRRQAVQSVESMQRVVERGDKFSSSTALMEGLVAAIIGAIENGAESVLAQVNDIEDRVIEESGEQDRLKLGPARRQAISLHRRTTTLNRLLARYDDADRLDANVHLCLRHLLQRLEAVHHDLHSAIERARLLFEEIETKQVAQTNNQLYILTVIGTLMLPPTFITGIFGMNVKGLLFSDDENGFIYSMLMCVASAALAYAIVFVLGGRKSKA